MHRSDSSFLSASGDSERIAGPGFVTTFFALFALVILLGAVAPPLWAQDKQSTPAAAAPGKLDAFAPLIGRDWTAPLPNGKLTDTQRFAWMYGKKFVRNTHFVKTLKGEVVYEGETIYAWDARSGRIVWWYWNASGGYLEGTASIGADGAITTEGQNHGDANQLDRTRSVIRSTADGWTFTPSYEKDGVWKNEPSRTYR